MQTNKHSRPSIAELSRRIIQLQKRQYRRWNALLSSAPTPHQKLGQGHELSPAGPQPRRVLKKSSHS